MSFMWAEKINYSHVQSAVENKGINLNNKVKNEKENDIRKLQSRGQKWMQQTLLRIGVQRC